MSLRPQNRCNNCSYTWFPRGKQRSLRCPGCSSRNIEVVQPPPRSSSGCGPVVLVAIVILIAVVWMSSRSGSGSSTPSTAASEAVAASAGGADTQSDLQPASAGDVASASQEAMPASDTPSTSDVASDASTSGGLNGAVPVAPSPKPSYATSFDCNKAAHEDEIAICGDPGLAAMDVELAELYEAALKSISDPKALEQSESGWVIARHLCDSDLICLRKAYGERIGQFKGSLGSPPLLPGDAPPEKP